MRNPPPQQSAATSPALRGPSRSSQPPNNAAERPRNTIPIVKVQRRSLTRQLQVVVNSASVSDIVLQAASVSPEMALLSGSQKTLRP